MSSTYTQLDPEGVGKKFYAHTLPKAIARTITKFNLQLLSRAINSIP